VHLDDLRRWAALLDNAVRVPGTRWRVGLDPILGLIPGAGDLVTPIFGVLILLHAVRLRIPKVVLTRMVFNTLLDLLLGIVPVAGDIFDFAWKANAKNFVLLERHAHPGIPATSGDWLFVLLCILVIAAVAVLPVLVFIWLVGNVPLI
jgi:hypothetical protein